MVQLIRQGKADQSGRHGFLQRDTSWLVSLAKTAPPLSVLPACIVSAISTSMLIQQKIAMGLVREGYALNGNDVEKAVQTLWPNAIFPLELWCKAHEIYWRGFADSNRVLYNVESPSLPKIDLTAKYFHTHLCALDVLSFFQKLSLNIQASILRKGFDFILEESYEDIGVVFPKEREFLFNTLLRLEQVDIFDQYSPDSELFEEKILSVPISGYHFITNVFSDTVLVDTVAVIRHFHNYPLRREVKGLTHRIVKFVLNSHELDIPSVPEAATAPVEVVEQPQDQKRVFRIPASLWEWKSDAAVRDAMKSDYPPFVIAYVLYNWCEVDKTQTGRLLSTKKFKEDKTYRNRVDKLLEKAASFDIIKA